ncbi:MAG: phosphoribosyl-ATP diphosphatase [Gammaproteobacteria bacterium]
MKCGICILGELAALAEARKTADPARSYTARLLRGDEDALLKKLAEEAGEAALAAKGGSREKLAEEIADLAFHCIVVMARYNVSLEEVAAALRARRGGSGLAEKSARREE